MLKLRALIPGMIVVVLLSLAVLGAACGDDEDDGEPSGAPANGNAETVSEVSLTEFAINLAADAVPAGSVTFDVRNDGTIVHDFIVIRTDLAADTLPMDEEAFVVDESQLEVVGSTAELDVGQSEDLALDLEAGSYVLICNIATHYDSGMFTAFTVE